MTEAAETSAAATIPPPAPSSYAALRAAARSSGNALAQTGQQTLTVAKGEALNLHDKAVYHADAARTTLEDTANELGNPALQQATFQAAETARTRALAAHAQATAAAEDLHASAVESGQRIGKQATVAADQAGKMAVAAADVARQQFDQRWNDVLNQERLLTLEAQKLEKYERQLSTLTRSEAPNFPPWRCCCIEPIVYHSIETEVPQERQKFVKLSYFNYWFTCVLLIFNFGIALGMIIAPDQGGNTAPSGLLSHFIVALIECIGIVLAFVLWYWPVYKACSTSSSGQHVMSYTGLAVAIIFNVVVLIGPMGYGGCGFLYGIAVRSSKGNNAFYVCLVNALLFGLQGVMFTHMFIRMMCRYGKEDKASLASANAEMARDSVLGGLRV